MYSGSMQMARYAEVAQILRERIESGEYPVGSQLPAISALQAEFNVPGQNTIRTALQLLAAGGYVRSRQGVGTFVLSATRQIQNKTDALAELKAARSAINRAISAIEAEQTADVDSGEAAV